MVLLSVITSLAISFKSLFAFLIAIPYPTDCNIEKSFKSSPKAIVSLIFIFKMLHNFFIAFPFEVLEFTTLIIQILSFVCTSLNKNLLAIFKVLQPLIFIIKSLIIFSSLCPKLICIILLLFKKSSILFPRYISSIEA